MKSPHWCHTRHCSFQRAPARELEHLALNFSSSVRLSALGLGEGGVFLLCALWSLAFLLQTSKTGVLLVLRMFGKGFQSLAIRRQEAGLRVNHSWDRQQLLGRKGSREKRQTDRGPQALTPRSRESAQFSGAKGCYTELVPAPTLLLQT